VLKAQLEEWGHKVEWAHKVLWVHKAGRGRQAHQEWQEWQGHKVHQERQGQQESLFSKQAHNWYSEHKLKQKWMV